MPVIAEGLYNNVKIDEDIFGLITVNKNSKKAVTELPK